MLPETIAHNRILKKIGQGGRGEVYLAKDTRLERPVALKILPAEFVNNDDRMKLVKHFYHRFDLVKSESFPTIFLTKYRT